MRWSPNLTEDLSEGLRPTFEQYAQQEKYGLAKFKAKTVNSVNRVTQRDTPPFIADASAELKLTSYRRKVGFLNKNNGSRQWREQQEFIEDFEITNILRTAGLEREPSLYYSPNSKITFKSAIPTDKLPVIGAKNLHLSFDHFKFPNPYFKNKERQESIKTSTAENNAGSSTGECRAHRKSYTKPVTDVMRWSPTLEEEDLSFCYGFRPTFEQDNYGLVTLNSDIVNEGVYDIQSDTSSLNADAMSSSGERTEHSKSFAESMMNVTGTQYVTPGQLYALKRGHNQKQSLRRKNSREVNNKICK